MPIHVYIEELQNQCRRYFEINNQRLFNKNIQYKDLSEIIDGYERDFLSLPNVFLKIRAKLAARELAFLLTKDYQYLIQLLAITLNYLRCPSVVYSLEIFRVININSKNENDFYSNIFSKFKDTFIGQSQAKRRKHYYWRGYYLYTKIVTAIKKYYHLDRLDKPKAKKYFNEEFEQWLISNQIKKLIHNCEDTPENLALQILEVFNICEPIKSKKSGQYEPTSQYVIKGFQKYALHLKYAFKEFESFPSELFSFFDQMMMNPPDFVSERPFEILNEINYLKVSKKIYSKKLGTLQSC